MAEVRLVFHDLPKAARDRFAACVERRAEPAPILAEPSPRGASALGWAALAVVLVGLVGLHAARGFGASQQDSVAGLVYAAGLALAFAAAFAARRAQRAAADVPFPPGRYVFARGFVDARGPELRVLPLELDDARADHGATQSTVTLTFRGGRTEAFIVEGRAAAAAALEAVRAPRAEGDDDEGDALAAVFDVRVGGAPAKRAGSPAFPLVLGVAAGAVAFLGRNRMSDDAAFAAAVATNTEASFQVYLAAGTRHADEVKTDLLPRAAFAAAVKQGTVTAIRGFLARYPRSPVEADARAALHARYDKALDDFSERRSLADARLFPFVRKLLAWLEKHEAARVDVVFERPSTQSLALVDTALEHVVVDRESGIAKVAPHFAPERSAKREAAIVNGLSVAFGAVFPRDMVAFGPAAAATAAPPAPAPSLTVNYRVGWSGDVFGDEKGGRKFVGIIVTFGIEMRIPDDADTLSFTISVKPPEEFDVKYAGEDEGGKDQPTEGRIYEAMAHHAFAELGDKLRQTFFRPDAPERPSGARRENSQPDAKPAGGAGP